MPYSAIGVSSNWATKVLDAEEIERCRLGRSGNGSSCKQMERSNCMETWASRTESDIHSLSDEVSVPRCTDALVCMCVSRRVVTTCAHCTNEAFQISLSLSRSLFFSLSLSLSLSLSFVSLSFSFSLSLSLYIYILYVCLCIYIDVVKLLPGPSSAVLNVAIWAKWVLLSGPSLLLAYFYSGLKRSLHTQLSFCVFCSRPVIRQFLIYFFVPNLFLFKFLCFELYFWNLSFFFANAL